VRARGVPWGHISFIFSLDERDYHRFGPEAIGAGVSEKMTLAIDINSDMVDAINGRLSDIGREVPTGGRTNGRTMTTRR